MEHIVFISDQKKRTIDHGTIFYNGDKQLLNTLNVKVYLEYWMPGIFLTEAAEIAANLSLPLKNKNSRHQFTFLKGTNTKFVMTTNKVKLQPILIGTTNLEFQFE